jgi:soluble lytic murein transglycosylase-like protein
MSILSALKMQSNSIDDLAKLPQAMIMQMAQKKQIDKEMLAPILARKAEMMEAVSRSKALQQPAQQPSVMEQVMAQNIQAENPANTVPQMPQQAPQMPQQMPQQAAQMPPQMPEAGVAQLPIPERQYAGGGIIAFAKGDLIDLDEEEDDNDILAEYAAAMEAGERASMGVPERQTENAGVGIRYRDPIPAGASRGIEARGEDGLARLRSQIMAKESGGRRFDKDGNLLTSSKGALGEMQVMPATAKDPGFGIRPARSNDPDELRRVGDEYAGVLLNKYKDPIVAMIAYNMGPGATDKWLAAGADPKKLPKETQGYIRNVTLAEGGEVKRFTKGGDTKFEADIDYFGDYLRRQKERFGGYLDELNPIPELSQDIRNYFTKPISRDADAQPGGFYGGTPAKPIAAPPKSTVPEVVAGAGFTPDEMIAGSTRAGTLDAMMRDSTSGMPLPSAKKAEPVKSRLDAFLEQQAASREDLAEQRKQDKNMALLAAGLGMLGGSSQYAFENVGKGGLAGVQYLSEANKQRAAEKAALDKAQVTAMRYQDLADIAKGGGERTLGIRQAELSERQRANSLNAVKAMRDDARNVAIAGLKQQGLLGEDLQNPNVAAKIEEQMRIILSNDPAFLQTYRDAFNVDYGRQAPVQSSTSVRKYDSKGKEIK